MDPNVIIAMAQLVLRYGPSAVEAIYNLMQTKEPTVEDIEGLIITKSPEDYFK